jgi:hypothetical protein
MNREGIRRLAAEELGLPTSPYRFVASAAEVRRRRRGARLPLRDQAGDVLLGQGPERGALAGGASMRAWRYSQAGSRAGAGRCIVEGFITFAYEITVLTVSAVNGLQCCPPIGHIQIDGDYRESWQPTAMSAKAWDDAQRISQRVVSALGGHGIFGVELFVCGTAGSGEEHVIFSEVSPRPHDTGLVTLGSQQYSEFAIHARAILGLPVRRASGCCGRPRAWPSSPKAKGSRSSMALIRRSACPRASCACSASRCAPASAAWRWRSLLATTSSRRAARARGRRRGAHRARLSRTLHPHHSPHRRLQRRPTIAESHRPSF